MYIKPPFGLSRRVSSIVFNLIFFLLPSQHASPLLATTCACCPACPCDLGWSPMHFSLLTNLPYPSDSLTCWPPSSLALMPSLQHLLPQGAASNGLLECLLVTWPNTCMPCVFQVWLLPFSFPLSSSLCLPRLPLLSFLLAQPSQTPSWNPYMCPIKLCATDPHHHLQWSTLFFLPCFPSSLTLWALAWAHHWHVVDRGC